MSLREDVDKLVKQTDRVVGVAIDAAANIAENFPDHGEGIDLAERERRRQLLRAVAEAIRDMGRMATDGRLEGEAA